MQPTSRLEGLIASTKDLLDHYKKKLAADPEDFSAEMTIKTYEYHLEQLERQRKGYRIMQYATTADIARLEAKVDELLECVSGPVQVNTNIEYSSDFLLALQGPEFLDQVNKKRRAEKRKRKANNGNSPKRRYARG